MNYFQLTALRQSAKISQEELAEKMNAILEAENPDKKGGITAAQLGAIENGERTFSVSLMNRYAEACGIKLITFAEKQDTTGPEMIRDIANYIWGKIDILQNERDFVEEDENGNPIEEFDPIKKEILDFLFDNFQAMKKLKGYWEPRYLEDQYGEWIHDENGEVIVDQEHQKTCPW
jgi:transcriptional regulator with XRE-family HTH domain